MGVQLDLIIPPIIVAMLVILIFQVNAFITETSVDNRLTNDMQTFADVTTRVIQEEVKSAEQINTPSNPMVPDSVLSFTDTSGETVIIRKVNQTLHVIHYNPITAVADTAVYPLMLSSLAFDLEPNNVATPHFLEVQIETESDPEQHASRRNNIITAKAFSEYRIYLRNVHMNSLP